MTNRRRRAASAAVASIRRRARRIQVPAADEPDRLLPVARSVLEVSELEHRRTTTPDRNPPSSGTRYTGAPPSEEADPGDEVQVRMRSPDDDRLLARARAVLVGDVEAWTLDLPEERLWDLRVPVRRRFTTLTIAEAGQATPWRIEACRRPSGWALTGPPDLGPGATIFCLWLAHLLDVGHVLRDRPWWAPSDWAVVTDDTGRLRPGGFHPDPGLPRSSVGAGGGGF